MLQVVEDHQNVNGGSIADVLSMVLTSDDLEKYE